MSAPRKKIGDRVFAFGTLLPRDAMRVELAIGGILSGALAAFGGTMPSLSAELSEAVTAKAIGAIVQHLSPDDYVDRDGRNHMGAISLMELVFQHVTVISPDPNVKPQQLDIDVHFAPTADGKARNKEKYLVLFEALKVNFSDFFPASPSGSSPERAPPA